MLCRVCEACNLYFLPTYQYIAIVSRDGEKPGKFYVDLPHYIAAGFVDSPSAGETASPSEGLPLTLLS